jgi:hypothetical protein
MLFSQLSQSQRLNIYAPGVCLLSLKLLLNRGFYAEKGGMKRVSGVTCLRAINGWIYLTK